MALQAWCPFSSQAREEPSWNFSRHVRTHASLSSPSDGAKDDKAEWKETKIRDARKTEWGWDRWVIGHSRNFLRKLFSGFSAKCKSVLLATRRPRRGVPLHDSNYYSAESKVVRPIERTPSTEISRTIVCSWSDVDSKTFMDVGPEFPHSRLIVWKQAKLGWLYPYYMYYNCTMIDYLSILFEVII